MNYINLIDDATLTDAAQLVSDASRYNDPISMKEALSTSVTGIAVVMIILALLAVLVVILSKLIRSVESAAKKKENKGNVTASKNAESKPQSKGSALPDTQSAGALDLYKTDEKTAAVIMAIVSNESGIPLNRLQFNSIKLIEK